MKGFTLVELLVVIAIIAVLAGIATPLILKAQKAGDRTKALANAKSAVSYIKPAVSWFRHTLVAHVAFAT